MTRLAQQHRNRAFTLLELLIVVAILAILIGLTLPAVQRVREVAVRLKGMHQLRQIGLGLHNYAATQGRMPGFVYLDRRHERDEPPLDAILSYVEASRDQKVALYLSPVDPTSALPLPRGTVPGDSSFAINKLAFGGLPDPAVAFTDGMSNTIAVAEHYARCGPNGRFNFHYTLRHSSVEPYDLLGLNEVRRASFADPYYGDVVPVPDGAGGVRPSRMGATFQVTPQPDLCDPFIPQTGHPAGMPVLRFDGSVRLITPGVNPRAFWAAVTRDGGEAISLD